MLLSGRRLSVIYAMKLVVLDQLAITSKLVKNIMRITLAMLKEDETTLVLTFGGILTKSARFVGEGKNLRLNRLLKASKRL